MAVDTAVRRASAVGFAAVAIVSLPFPDASIDDVDRVALAHSYAGISLDVYTGTASNVINAVSQGATGAVEVTGTAGNVLDNVSQSASGNFGPTGTASNAINAVSQAAEGSYIGPVTGTAGNVLNNVTQSASGSFGPSGTAANVIDAVSQSASGHTDVTGTAGNVINAIGQDGDAYTAPVTITLSGYSDAIDGTYSVELQYINRTLSYDLIKANPWYSDSPTLEACAQDAAGQFGYADVNTSNQGPYFYWWNDQHEHVDDQGDFGTTVSGSDSTFYWYAIATEVEVEVEAEVVEEEAPSGGWAAINAYDSYRQKKRDRERRKRELEAYLASLEPVDREIAELMADTSESQSELALRDLEALVDEYQDQVDQASEYNQRVGIALERAARQRNYSAMMAFEREMERAVEEEEFLLLAMALLS